MGLFVNAHGYTHFQGVGKPPTFLVPHCTLQWVFPESNKPFKFPIAYTSNWTLAPSSEAPGTGYYTFLEVVRDGMTGATINTYSGSGQILDHTIRAIAIGW